MSDYSDGNRFAPPRAGLADVPTPEGGLPLASRWGRLGAVILDFIASWVVTYVVGLAGGHSYFEEVRSFGRDGSSVFTAYGVMAQHYGLAWVILLAVQGWMLHSWGGTIGKRLLNIRIVRTDGRRAGFARLFFLRACVPCVLYLIPLLGGLVALVDMLMIFRASRRCLHDVIADTVVVRVLHD